LTLLYFTAQNIDRLVSFYRASLKTGKIFAIDFYTANILGCLQNYGGIPYPSENYANIRVFFPQLRFSFNNGTNRIIEKVYFLNNLVTFRGGAMRLRIFLTRWLRL